MAETTGAEKAIALAHAAMVAGDHDFALAVCRHCASPFCQQCAPMDLRLSAVTRRDRSEQASGGGHS
jgi:hypothetical protein